MHTATSVTSTSVLSTGITTTTSTTATTTTTSTTRGLAMVPARRRANSAPSALPQRQHFNHQNALSRLAPEIKVRIFEFVVCSDPTSRLLHALAQTSHAFRQAVKGFYLELKSGKEAALRLLDKRNADWVSDNKWLLNRVVTLRRDFNVSAMTLEKEGPLAMATCLNAYASLGVSLENGPLSAELLRKLPQARALRVKLAAGGIGRERFLKEALPLIEMLSVDRRLIVDASRNGLTGADIESIVDIALRSGNLVSLDFSDNPLCKGTATCQALVDLVSFDSPLFQLYLKNTGLNDKTAEKMGRALRKHKHPCMVQLDLRDNQLGISGAFSFMCSILRGTGERMERFSLSLRKIRLQGNPCIDQRKAELAKQTFHLRFDDEMGAMAATIREQLREDVVELEANAHSDTNADSQRF